jgi:hypothetical protein
LDYEYTADLFNDLTGNVTAALFSSMEILPGKKVDINLLTNQQLLEMYMKLLAFVYIYFFVVASISMVLLAAFQVLCRRHEIHFHRNISTTVRIVLATSLASLVSFASHFPLAYSFMTSPVILYAFTLTLLCGQFLSRCLLFDMKSDWFKCSWLTDFWTISHSDAMQLADGTGEAVPSLSVVHLHRGGWK